MGRQRLCSTLLAAVIASAGASACFTGVLIEGESESDAATAGSSTSGASEGASASSGEPTTSTSTTSTSTTGTTTSTTSTSTTDASTTVEPTTTTSDSDSSGGVLDECPRVRVVVPNDQVLNVRPDPSTANAPVGTLANGAIVDVVDLVHGELLEDNDEWFEITSKDIGGFVWSGLVECTLDEPPELGPPSGFWLPLQCGTTTKVTQGNNGQFSHSGTSAYAFDFSLGVGTPLVAIADGEVIYTYDKTKPGDPCYNGGDASCINKANVVTLLHGDDTTSIYAHLSAVQVSVGGFVPRGTAVGLSGSTGYSTGRHAHVARQEKCGSGFCQSIPVAFEDVVGDGVPETGDTVTSMNCP